jgi:hypothetical protein
LRPSSASAPFGLARRHLCFSFDVGTLRAAALADPAGFVASMPARMVLDEVQRVPEIFTALKVAVDSDRAPGHFLLTGSANVLLLPPRLADSLAGACPVGDDGGRSQRMNDVARRRSSGHARSQGECSVGEPGLLIPSRCDASMRPSPRWPCPDP